jgi:hypothetical protein
VLELLATLVLTLSMVMTVPALAQPAFTGDVETDFPDADPSILIFADAGGKDVLVPAHPVTNTSSGWDIKDVRLTYDSATDILYVGLNSYETVGDADTNGNEGTKTYGPGVDVPNLGVGESVSVYFDLDVDGNWDVIVGVPDNTDFFGFAVRNAIGTTPGIALFGAIDLSAHLGTVYWSPGSAPDLEFQILDFDGLPNQGGELGAFAVGAFMGSSADVDIVEDILIGSASPAINIVKKTNGSDNNSAPGPYIAVNGAVNWTYEVTNTDSDNLTNIVVADNKGTPGYMGDDFNPSPVDVSPADGFNDGDTDKDNELDLDETWLYQATGSATVGQYSNTATATGYFGGIPVSATDPDNYLGVKAKIEISPLAGTNRIGESHNLTACVYVDTGSGYALYAQPITINFSNVGVGNLSATTVPTNTGCAQTTLTSDVVGKSTVTAQSAFTVGGAGGASFNISTDDTGDNRGPAEKIWGEEVGIDIEKYVSVDGGSNWLDADAAAGPSAVAGSNVKFCVTVCNKGSANLTNILVSDTDFTFTDIATSLAAGQCDNSTIVTVAAVAGQQWDVANVTAQADGIPVFDEDAAYYTGLHADIDIEKYVSVDGEVTWLDADSATGPSAVAGSNVKFYVSVCNNGSADLTNILVSDTDFTFTDIATSLAAGQCDNSTIVTVAAVAGQQWDVANVTAQADGIPVFDEDAAYYSGSPLPLPLTSRSIPMAKTLTMRPGLTSA